VKERPTEKNLRRLGSISFTRVLSLLLGFALGHMVSAAPASAQSSQPLRLLRASKPSIPASPKAPDASLVTNIAPPGSALYLAKRGDSVALVARHYLSQTSYLTSGELAEALRKANRDVHGNFLKAGQPVIVPGILEAPIVEKTVPVARDFEQSGAHVAKITKKSPITATGLADRYHVEGVGFHQI